MLAQAAQHSVRQQGSTGSWSPHRVRCGVHRYSMCDDLDSHSLPHRVLHAMVLTLCSKEKQLPPTSACLRNQVRPDAPHRPARQSRHPAGTRPRAIANNTVWCSNARTAPGAPPTLRLSSLQVLNRRHAARCSRAPHRWRVAPRPRLRQTAARPRAQPPPNTGRQHVRRGATAARTALGQPADPRGGLSPARCHSGTQLYF